MWGHCADFASIIGFASEVMCSSISLPWLPVSMHDPRRESLAAAGRACGLPSAGHAHLPFDRGLAIGGPLPEKSG